MAIGHDVIQRNESLGFRVFVDESTSLEDVSRLLRAVDQLTGNEDLAEQAAQAFLGQPVSVHYQIRHTPRIIEGASTMCGKIQLAREHYSDTSGENKGRQKTQI
jgi:hypothetical protein